MYRGEISIRITEDDDVSLRFYPDGIFELSTGLLDFIDETLFASAGTSARRMRHIDTEREKMLLPFIATEAGLFAADAEFSAYSRLAALRGKKAADDAAKASAETPLAFSERETFLADVCAVSILANSGVFLSYIDWLEYIYNESTGNPALQSYVARFPDHTIRGENIKNEIAAPGNAVVKLNTIVNSLKTGFGEGEASKAVDDLEERIPEVVYLHRLKAMLAHASWEKSAFKNGDPDGAKCISMLPFARSLDTDRTNALKEATRTIESRNHIFFGSLPATQKPEGDEKLYKRALDAYEKCGEYYNDFTLRSAQAFLTAQSADETEIERAIAVAAEAALKEAGSSSVIARTNYARLLFLCGKDIPLAVKIMEGIFPDASGADASANAAATQANKETRLSYVSPGFSDDLRTAATLYASLLLHNGRADVAAKLLGAYTAIPADSYDGDGASVPGISAASTAPAEHPPAAGTNQNDRVLFKSIGLGDTTDIVASVWGEPAEIAFNTESETWTYPELFSQVLFIPTPYADEASGLYEGTVSTAVMLTIFNNSSVSLPGDLRTGDGRESVEAVFGPPVYRADDAYVYVYNGLRFKISYSCDGKAGNGSIRAFSVSF